MLSLVTGLLLGLLLGMRHALEPDHLAAVSNLMASRGRSPRAGAILGACWGIGHSLALFTVGCLLAVLNARLPTSIANGFELLVSVMLVILGGRSILRAGDRDSIRHDHDPVPIRTRWTAPKKSMAVGLVHGLAGSGALTALVVASLPTVATRLAYIFVFGLGSIGGMALLTGIAGWPLSRVGPQGRVSRWLEISTGVFSILFGVGWGIAVTRDFLS